LSLFATHQNFRLAGNQIQVRFEADALGIHLEGIVTLPLYYHLITQSY
jgi:hypothetical protein